MKKAVGFLLIAITLFTLSYPAFAAEENDYWSAIEKGDYQSAANVGRELGIVTPEYYLLTSICYLNLSQYQASDIYRIKFERNGDPIKLRNILLARQSCSQDQPQVLLLEAITTIAFPEINLGEATDYLNKIGNRLSDNPYYYNCLASQAIKNRDYSSTVQKQLQKAIVLKKDYPEPYQNLANIFVQNKATEKAITLLLDCLTNCPEVSINIYESLVKLTGSPTVITIKPFGEEISASTIGFKVQYQSKIKVGLEKVPNHLLGLAEYFITMGNPISARDLLLNINFDNSSLYTYLQLKIANLEGVQDQVTAYGNDLLNQNNLDYRRLVETGNVFFYTKDFKLAESFYIAALPLSSADDEIYLNKIHANLGIIYYFKQEYQQAITELEKAISYDSKDPISWVNLGLTYRDLRDKTKAMDCFNQSLEFIHDPDWREEVNGIMKELTDTDPVDPKPE